MSSTHDVNCKNCGKHLAWWSQWDNIQYADEYQCKGAIRTRNNEFLMNVFSDKDFKKLNVIKKEKRLGFTRWTYCKIKNHTYYCETCAKKLKHRCSVCGGKIVLTRKY